MKTRPILMNGEMVRAVLAGRKSQTRRMVKPQPQTDGGSGQHPVRPFQMPDGRWRWVLEATGVGVGEPFECPMGVAGDRLYIRETMRQTADSNANGCVQYAADESIRLMMCENMGEGDPVGTIAHDRPKELAGKDGPPWTPSIIAPKWTSRITLEITDVRIERLNAITDADAIAEGIERTSNGLYCRDYIHGTRNVVLPIYSFMTLWQSIYGPESWSANPWVFAIAFKRLEGVLANEN